jgi:glycine oxidase
MSIVPGPSHFDAVFVGGGVIGLAGAWRSAQGGLAVALVDPRPGHGATWAAAGMLAPVTEAHYGEEALVRLNVTAAGLWPAFAQELEAASGVPIGYLRHGTVVVAADGSDRLAIDEVLAFQRSLGLGATRLSARECRALEPSLAPGLRGGVDVPGDHQVDNRQLVAALLVACREAGVSLVADRATAVSLAAGPAAAPSPSAAPVATGVELEGGTALVAGSVVVTAGCHSDQLGGLPPGTLPPVRPVKGMTLRLAAPAQVPRLQRTLRGLVHGESCYLVPRDDGSVVVGATVEEKGFDNTVQVRGLYELLRDARTVVPGLDEYELTETAVGLRPGSPDNAPSIGRTAVPGLLVATGHYRNGILLAPLTADALTGLLVGGEGTDIVAPFGPERFGSARSGAA